jgi:hypothetical protein
MPAPSRRLTNQLLDATTQAARIAAEGRSVQLRFGVVDAVDTPNKVIDVTVADAPLYDIPYMASYSPTVNDVVWLLQSGSTMVAIGKY